MNINKGDEVYAIYKYGDNNEYYNYRKEKFIKYENGYPVCTVNLEDGVTMGYEEVCLTIADAESRYHRLMDLEKDTFNGYKIWDKHNRHYLDLNKYCVNGYGDIMTTDGLVLANKDNFRIEIKR